ncbi:MAG: protein kinase [Myxococcales bacterium]|nr:protein kinase [Myxococcales bacterium]MCB9714011.1 protein kinase [Myxococcales bacterium]
MTTRLEIGDRIGTSVIERVLGEGGFGRVYRVRSADGEARAVKVAHEPTEAMSTVELGLLQNEIEAMLRLRHPGLVRTHGYGYLDDGRLYLEMELVQGMPLIEHVDRHDRLDPVEALAIVERVAEVMGYCHEQGVLHLDLKPDNIVITDRHGPHLKVLDFGVARLARAWRGGQRVIAGTPAYMAPECFTDEPRHSSMDVYALGVTLHVMLTGRLAFEEQGVTAQIHDKYAGPPPLDSVAWEQAPPGLKSLLRSMLAVDPRVRPTMKALRAATRRLMFSALSGGRGASTDVTDPSPSQPIQVEGLYGRDAELAALRQRWAEARTQPKGPTLVLGPQGVGKSALLERFLLEHGEPPTLVADGRCRESGDLVPFASLREAAGRLGEAMRSLPHWRTLGRELRESLGPLEGVLIALVPEAQPPGTAGAIEPPARPGPEAVARAIHGLLQVVARHHPLVLVLEDVQWAGTGAQAVMRYLATMPVRGAFVLMSARERPPWAEGMDAIELGSLPAADNRALLRALLTTEDPQVIERLVLEVPALATGIPMATVQVTADLQLQSCVRRLPGGGVEIDEARLRAYVPPATVAEVLERRLARLDPRARRVLGVGALMGRGFDRDDVVGTELHGIYEVQAAMLDAHALGLARVQSNYCQLAHEALACSLAAQWEPQQARMIHAKIAAQLERRGKDPGRRAHHLEQAGDPLAAARVHLVAAHHADALHDLAGAERHFRRAIELGDGLPRGPERTGLLREAAFEYARVAGALGHLDEAFAVVGWAARALSADGVSMVEDYAIDSALARLRYLRGDMPSAVELATRCLQHAGDRRRTRRYRVLPANLVGRALYVRGRYGEAAVALQRGCELAAAENDSVELCHSLGMLGLSLGYTGALDEARVHLSRAARLADELEDPVRRVAASCYAAIAAEQAYDREQGVIRSAEALARAQRYEVDGLYLYLSFMVAGRQQFHVGQLPRARLLLEHAVELSRRQGLGTGVGWAHSFLGDVALVQGDYDEAARAYDAGLKAGATDEYAVALGLAGWAHVRALTSDDFASFEADAQEAMARLERGGNVATQPQVLLRLAEGSMALGDEEGAQARRDQAAAIFARLGVEPVGWWPAAPEGTGAETERAHWEQQAREAELELRPFGSPTADAIRRVTLKITEDAQRLQGLTVRMGGMKPG